MVNLVVVKLQERIAELCREAEMFPPDSGWRHELIRRAQTLSDELHLLQEVPEDPIVTAAVFLVKSGYDGLFMGDEVAPLFLAVRSREMEESLANATKAMLDSAKVTMERAPSAVNTRDEAMEIMRESASSLAREVMTLRPLQTALRRLIRAHDNLGPWNAPNLNYAKEHSEAWEEVRKLADVKPETCTRCNGDRKIRCVDAECAVCASDHFCELASECVCQDPRGLPLAMQLLEDLEDMLKQGRSYHGAEKHPAAFHEGYETAARVGVEALQALREREKCQ